MDEEKKAKEGMSSVFISAAVENEGCQRGLPVVNIEASSPGHRVSLVQRR